MKPLWVGRTLTQYLVRIICVILKSKACLRFSAENNQQFFFSKFPGLSLVGRHFFEKPRLGPQQCRDSGRSRHASKGRRAPSRPAALRWTTAAGRPAPARPRRCWVTADIVLNCPPPLLSLDPQAQCVWEGRGSRPSLRPDRRAQSFKFSFG